MLSGSMKMKAHLGDDLAEHDPGEDAPDGAGEGEDDGVHHLGVVLCKAPSVPQPVVQSRRRPLLGPSPG